MLWAYFSFSQYLIIWSGNLPAEIAWYLHRLQTGWRFVGVTAGRFFISPCRLRVLLSRTVKREARAAGQGRRRHPDRPADRSVLADRTGVSSARRVGQLARRGAAADAGDRSGSAASSGSCAAARFCRCTIRNSRKRSARSSSAAHHRGRLINMSDATESHQTAGAHAVDQHEASDVNVSAVFTFGAGLVVTVVVVASIVFGLFRMFDRREARSRSSRLSAGRRTGRSPAAGAAPADQSRARTCATCAIKEDERAQVLRLGGQERRHRPHSDRRCDQADAGAGTAGAATSG